MKTLTGLMFVMLGVLDIPADLSEPVNAATIVFLTGTILIFLPHPKKEEGK